MRFLFGLANIVVVAGLFASAILGIVMCNEGLQRHPLSFLAFWVFIPIVSCWLTLGSSAWSRTTLFQIVGELLPLGRPDWDSPGNSMSPLRFFDERALKTFTSFLRGSVFVLSPLVLLNWEKIRDDVGKRYMPGYSVLDGVVLTEHWYMWLFEVLLVVGAIAVPAFTVVLTRMARDSHAEYYGKYWLPTEQKKSSKKPKILLSAREADGLIPTLTRVFENWGYSTTSISSLPQVVEQLKTVEYDLVILDLCDSDVELSPGQLLKLHNRILFLTCDHETHALLLPSGYTAVVEKPIDLEKLSSKLREMLQG